MIRDGTNANEKGLNIASRGGGVREKGANRDHIFPVVARDMDSPASSKGMFRL
jgi:hypothetical protein